MRPERVSRQVKGFQGTWSPGLQRYPNLCWAYN